MNDDKNFKQEEQQVHPVIIWILASILLHLLLTLGVISLKIHRMSTQESKMFDTKTDQAILMMDQKKQPPLQQAQPAAQPKAPAAPPAAPKEKPKEQPLDLSKYTLVAGRKGQDKQQLDNSVDLKNLPTPETQKVSEKQPQPKVPKNEKIEQQAQEEQPEKKEIKPIIEQSKMGESIQAEQKYSPKMEKKLKGEPVPAADQDPYKYVPTPSRVVSFKELNLGFDYSRPNIGNNANLSNQGSTFDAPDGIALKHLTYYNQCAEMMRTEFSIHPQRRLRPYPTGKKYNFMVTVNRQGKLLKFTVINPSGDSILDKILAESVQAVTMFPPVPNFISGDPFTMEWRFLH
jgi:hypothetical protein